MKRKKIFIYIHQCILKGGVEKAFFNLLNNLPEDKYEITVLSIMAYLHDDINDQLYPSFVKRKWFYYDEWSKNWLKKTCQRLHNRFMPSLYKWLLKFKYYDVAIAAQEGQYAKFVIENVKAKKKLLWIHNDITKCHWTEKLFGNAENEKSCYENFDSIICVSQTVKDSMLQVFGRLDNLCVRYNPIDTNEIERFLRSKLPPRDEKTLFVCVGRLAKQKGYDRLFNVCEKLNTEGYQYNVDIIGEGEDRPLLMSMLKEKGITNVRLLGNKKNPFVYMKNADWLLLPSRHEGFGMVIQEAVICGTPIVTTLVSGAKELLGDSEYGIIVDNSEEGIYQGMRKVLDKPECRLHYIQKTLERKDFIDINKRISDIENLF